MHRYKTSATNTKVNSEWIAIANVQLIGTSLIDFPASLSHPRSAPGTPKRKSHCVAANVFSMLTNMVAWFWASTHFSMTSLKDTVKTFCCETVP